MPVNSNNKTIQSYTNSNNKYQNINIIRVQANNDEILEQMRYRNKEEVEFEVGAPEAQDWEFTEKLQNEIWENEIWENEIREISKFQQLKHGEVNRGIKDERWHSGKLKKIKKTKHRKLEVKHLRAVSRESNIRARSSKGKRSILEDKAYGEDDSYEEWEEEDLERPCETKSSRQKYKVYEGKFVEEEAFSEEDLERPVRMAGSIDGRDRLHPASEEPESMREQLLANIKAWVSHAH